MTKPKWWDCTLSREKKLKNGNPNFWANFTTEDIGKHLMQMGAERCVVGEEIGEEGYHHWQIKVVFKKGKSDKEVINVLLGGHWTQSVDTKWDYCMKSGNYWCSWDTALAKYGCMPLYPWQNEVLNRVQSQDDRRVTVIVDELGNSGKTTLAKMVVAKRIGAYCPAMDTAQDYMAWALAHSDKNTFILDMPKSDMRKKNKDLWSAVEQMKNGYLWDKRHHWQERWIEPPKLLVLTNEKPDEDLLSRDRWDIGTLTHGISNWANTVKWERKL